MASQPKVLLLGGTKEARELAETLALQGFAVVYSLAGITPNPKLPKHAYISLRQGGFGGIDGLKNFVSEQGITAVVEATHPFASQMKQAAASLRSVPVLHVERPSWQAASADKWTHVQSLDACISHLSSLPQSRVFLALGAKHLSRFSALKDRHQLVARSIVSSTMHGVKLILQEPPYELEAELDLFCREGIDLLVTRNSGTPASWPKLEAARQLELPVLMIDPPKLELGTTCSAAQLPKLLSHALAKAAD